MIPSKKILVWFRNDLRLHDNEVLVEAISKSDLVLPVYVVDERQFQPTHYHTLKTGVNRTKFILESIQALREGLQTIGGNLLIRIGKPEEVIPELVAQFEIAEVFHHREVAEEETHVSTLLENNLWRQKINLKHIIGHTLYNKEDLPFPIKDIPDTFPQFKKKVDREALVKPCFHTPSSIAVPEVENWGTIPSLRELGFADALPCNDILSTWKGGEAAAFMHMQQELDKLKELKQGKLPVRDTGLSPWLALGCLSLRTFYWALKELEVNTKNRTAYNHILSGLLWRDYYRFMFKKHGNKFFHLQGFSEEQPLKHADEENQLQLWKSANTGMPLVDKLMKTLKSRGYINNTERQFVAAYLVYEQGVRWVYGAAYFEEALLDYNPASNWGNWANLAGLGNDPNFKFAFDLEKQLKNLDPEGGPKCIF